jgi:hypothetical protein
LVRNIKEKRRKPPRRSVWFSCIEEDVKKVFDGSLSSYKCKDDLVTTIAGSLLLPTDGTMIESTAQIKEQLVENPDLCQLVPVSQGLRDLFERVPPQRRHRPQNIAMVQNFL